MPLIMTYTKDEILVLGISLIMMVGISVFLMFLLKGKAEKTKKIPFLIITIILLILEITKQIRAIINGYSSWVIPLHFCSTYWLWFTLANFTKGKFQKSMQTVAIVSSFYLFALFYFDPTSIIGDVCKNIFLDFDTFHTFFFHHLVLLYFILSIFLKQWKFEYSHLTPWAICMGVYYSVAVFFANLFNTNYMNILYSNIFFMEKIRLNLGQVFYNILLGLLTVGVGLFVIFVTTKIIKSKENKNV